MRRVSFFLVFVSLLFVFLSCQKGSSNVNTNSPSIVGTWNLQQENVVQFVNGVQTKDTTLSASSNSIAAAKFNSDNSFKSVSLLYSTNVINTAGGGGQIVAEQDSVSGTYTVSGTSLTLSSVLAGLISSNGSYFNSTTISTLPTFALISNSSQINMLTTSNLNIHTEIVYSETVNAITTSYKNEYDYFYTK